MRMSPAPNYLLLGDRAWERDRTKGTESPPWFPVFCPDHPLHAHTHNQSMASEDQFDSAVAQLAMQIGRLDTTDASDTLYGESISLSLPRLLPTFMYFHRG